MAMIQFHTPKGIVEIDTRTVTDRQLKSLGITRDTIKELEKPDQETRLAELEARVTGLESKE